MTKPKMEPATPGVASDDWDNRLCRRLTKSGKRCRAHAALADVANRSAATCMTRDGAFRVRTRLFATWRRKAAEMAASPAVGGVGVRWQAPGFSSKIANTRTS
jgi:hypothetical protein